MSNPSFPSDSGKDAVVAEVSLLDAVLRQTRSFEDMSAKDRDELAPLLGVARKYRGHPLSLEPVVLELVQAILKDHFANTVRSQQAWQQMTQHIARTMYEDPSCHARLESLWNRLTAEA